MKSFDPIEEPLIETSPRRDITRSIIAGVLFALACFAVAALGSLATSSSVHSEWFKNLYKPSWYPPSSAFGIVWTILYIMIAVSGWLAWRSGAGRVTIGWWIVQLLLNLAWSVVFFGLRQPAIAVAVIALLLVAIVGTIAAFWRFNRLAAGLLVPYLLWVCFASALNIAIAFGK